MRRIIFGVFTIAVLAACGDNGPTTPIDPAVAVALAPDSIAITIGETQQLTVLVTGSTKKATFTSSNTNIATVDSAGVVTAKGVGTAFIRANVGAIVDSSKVVVKTLTILIPGPLPLLGSGSVPERFTGEITEAGGWAYSTTWSNRAGNPGNAVKIWNVSGNTPILSDSIILPGVGTTSDAQISDDGQLLAISLEGSSQASLNGFALYNRSVTPGKPALVARYTSTATNPGVHTLKFARINGRHYLFLDVDPPAALVIVDITTPAAPVEVLNRRMGNPYIHDVFVRDGILFAGLWNDGMSIFDVGGGGRGGSPSNPVLLGNVHTAVCPGCAVSTTASEVHNIWWFNDPRTGSKKYAFIGEEGPASLFGFSKGDIHVVDVSDFTNPREVAFFRPDSATTSTGTNAAGTHNFDVDEPSGILYAAYYNGGVRALDIRGDLSTCTAAQKSADGRCNLRLMGREVGIGLVSFPVFVWGVKLDGNFLYASDMPNGIHKLNIAALKR